ncbi:MAG TPA: transcriptional regulator [Ruminococcus sp.]|nr:transcriptional regulator [Ruminococcus sp.]
MDQVKIGGFLRELRKEKQLTQEQLAEQLSVTARTVSRWENGNNMPDLSILVELSEFYGVDIREIIDGERMQTEMNEDMKETLSKVADYTDAEKAKLIKDLRLNVIFSCIALLVLYIMLGFNLTERYDLNEHALWVTLVGLIASGGAVVNLMQIHGSMNKHRMKKLRSVLIPVCMAVLAFCVILVMVLITGVLN